MSTRRRRTTTTRAAAAAASVRRTRTSRSAGSDWLGAAIVAVVRWTFQQPGLIWGELSHDQRRAAIGIGMLTGGALVLVSEVAPGAEAFAALHRLTWAAVGYGWPLLVGGSWVGGMALIRPPARPVQRLEVCATLAASCAVLGLASLAWAPAGGALGTFAGPTFAAKVTRPFAIVLLVLALLGGVTVLVWLREWGTHFRIPATIVRRGAAPVTGVGLTTTQELPAGAVSIAEPAAGSALAEVVEEAAEPVEAPAPPVPMSTRWTLPNLSLLAAPKPRTRRQEHDVQGTVAVIESKMWDLGGVKGKVVGVDHGPTVTRFALEIPPTVPLSKVESMARDIALALASAPINIPGQIEGRAAIGLEVPNKQRHPVGMREILDSEGLAPTSRALRATLGVTVAGEPVLADLARMPHLLIAGATGQGKSVCLNVLILGLLLQHSPETLRLVMIDPKRVEMLAYGGLPHLAAPVVVEPRQAVQALRWATAEMDARYKILARVGVRNIAGYNERTAAKGEPPMPFVVVVIDELADLMMVSKQRAAVEKRAGCEVEDLIVRIAQLARAVGIHLVVATQRPSVDVITGLVKANMPCRIAFQVASGKDSQVVLDSVGAEKLLGAGDMLYLSDGRQQTRLQCPLVSDPEIEAVVRHWTSQGAPEYLTRLEEEDA